MTVMKTEIFETLNQRITVETPVVTREQLHAALSCFVGRLVTPELKRDMQVTVATLLAPKITIEECSPPSSLLIHLPLYQHISVGHRQVRALKVAAVIPNPRGIELHFENTRYAPIQVSNRWNIDWAPEPGGYYGHAQNGEPFYMSADGFNENYTMIEVGA
jgi:hypothetical protein